jgi:hypothetical protein
METNNKSIVTKTKKDILSELLVDPTTFQYKNDDRRNTSNDYEITTNKTTDQLSQSVDQPEDMYFKDGYGSYFFYEDEHKEVQTEEVLKKTELKDITDDKVEEKILQIINSITDELSEKENIKDLDRDLVNKLIDQLKHSDKILS